MRLFLVMHQHVTSTGDVQHEIHKVMLDEQAAYELARKENAVPNRGVMHSFYVDELDAGYAPRALTPFDANEWDNLSEAMAKMHGVA